MIETLTVEINVSTGKGGQAQSKSMNGKGAQRKATEKVRLGDVATVLQRSQRLLVVVVHDLHVSACNIRFIQKFPFDFD